MRDRNSDIKKIADAVVANLGFIDAEFGGIGIDCKRPFGNSMAWFDLFEIIGLEPDREDGDYSEEWFDYVSDIYRREVLPYIQKRWGAE
jgi:hypothetical protein